MFKLYEGKNQDVMGQFPGNSIDSIVTDPPYELGFMGKSWDQSGVAYDVSMWAECLRVLKPGGYILSFGGSRTYHRMACAIEDAGFEIRDQIMWVYGSGFPKSRNLDGDRSGWGTALKPAHEPIVVARKPLDGTVAANVIKWGTGALNIDGCRVELNGDYKCKANGRPSQTGLSDNYDPEKANQPDTMGRWPANVIHDGSGEVLECFPESKGQRGNLIGHNKDRQSPNGCFGKMAPAVDHMARKETEKSAARFFYCAKASKSERGPGNNHPTVKPVSLMRYLVRLVTPPEGVVLDPFMGSATTGLACIDEGLDFIGIEKNHEYFEICKNRIARMDTVS